LANISKEQARRGMAVPEARKRKFTREELYAWAERAERLSAERYGFRPSRPLSENQLFLYLLTQAARGRVPEGDPGIPESKIMMIISAATGIYFGDTVHRRFQDNFIQALLEAGMDPAEFGEGLVGYLLINRADMPEVFVAREVLYGRVALIVAVFFMIGGILGIRATVMGWWTWEEFVADTILWFADPLNGLHLGLLALASAAAGRLLEPLFKKMAIFWETWNALFSILNVPGVLSLYLADFPLNAKLLVLWFGVRGRSDLMDRPKLRLWAGRLAAQAAALLASDERGDGGLSGGMGQHLPRWRLAGLAAPLPAVGAGGLGDAGERRDPGVAGFTGGTAFLGARRGDSAAGARRPMLAEANDVF
jgi:hypothetical protein